MSRCFAITCFTLFLFHIEPGKALADHYAIRGPNDSKTEIAGDGAKLRWVETSSSTTLLWALGPLAKQTKSTIQVSGGKRDIWYLTYLGDGKEPKVYLRQKSGALWKFTHVGGVSQFTIQATRGKFKGWYLAQGDGGKVVLSKKPKRVPTFSVYTVSP
jgi:hypothetical protein